MQTNVADVNLTCTHALGLIHWFPPWLDPITSQTKSNTRKQQKHKHIIY